MHKFSVEFEIPSIPSVGRLVHTPACDLISQSLLSPNNDRNASGHQANHQHGSAKHAKYSSQQVQHKLGRRIADRLRLVVGGDAHGTKVAEQRWII